MKELRYAIILKTEFDKLLPQERKRIASASTIEDIEKNEVFKLGDEGNEVDYYIFKFFKEDAIGTKLESFRWHNHKKILSIIKSGTYSEEENKNKITETSPFASKTLASGEKLFKREHGMGSLDLNPGEVGHFEFEIPYPWCKLEGLEIMDQEGPIEADLFIEDSTDGNYSGISRSELNQFGFDVNIPKNYYQKTSKFDSDLFYGMWVVLQIQNTSNVQQSIRANVELNEVR